MKKKLNYPNADPVTVIVTDPKEHIQKNWMGGHFYETHGGGLLNWVKNNVPHKGIYIDIGANIGNHTLFMLGVMKAEKVIAIEPVHELFTQCLENCLENDWLPDSDEPGRIEMVNSAVGSRKGKMKMALKDKGTNNTGMWQRSTTGETVAVDRIDAIVNRVKPPKIDYIKIDVEHMEIEAIQGAKKTLDKFKPVVSIECEDSANLPKLDALFLKSNYKRVEGVKTKSHPYVYLPAKVIISKDHIFFHIPKTAGQSVTSAYFKGHGITEKNNGGYNLITGEPIRDGHLYASEVRELVGSETYDSAFKFAVVRNPFDRMISFYLYGQKKLRPNIMKSFTDFVNFVCGSEKENPGQGWLNARISQSEFLNDKIDRIYRFEYLQANWSAICNQLGINAPLPHLNKSANEGFREFYTAKAKNMIEDYFKEDLERFGYEW